MTLFRTFLLEKIKKKTKKVKLNFRKGKFLYISKNFQKGVDFDQLFKFYIYV